MAPRRIFLPLFLSYACATHLWATHYAGNVYSLTLDQNANNGSFTLSVSSTLKTCGGLPSWLTFDSPSRTVFCSDESGDSQTPGSLTSFHANDDGTLTELAKTQTLGGGVNNVLYKGGDGAQYIAIAHYSASGISTFALPLTANARQLQKFQYSLKHPGPVPDRQEAPHPHEVFLDPTGKFILSPDLGADVVRVYTIATDSGKLSECPSLNVAPGSGPRHGLFWQSKSATERKLRIRDDAAGGTDLHIVSELGGTLATFTVTHTSDGCLAFQQTQSIIPYTDGKLPNTNSFPGELRVADNNAYVSIRGDQGFPPNDSMSTLVGAADGGFTFTGLTSSFGMFPRTFVINKAGDMVAIGNQNSANVAIVKRDPQTGALGPEIANVQLTDAEGLSSVIWDE